MDPTRLPLTDDCGVVLNNTMLPVYPLQYVPAKGECGLVADGKFVPIDPPSASQPLYQVFPPLLVTSQEIDREPPFLPQTGMAVAPTCVAPYDWNAATALRTVILDTVLDADATPEEKALPGYVPNPGLTLRNQTYEDIVAGIEAEAATALLQDRTYRITTIGDTDFTAIGAASNTVGLEFVATGAGTGTGTATPVPSYNDLDGVGILWTYGASPADPHPALRTGQTRYSFPGTAKVGTDLAEDGAAFLPGTAGEFVGGTLKTCAYRYGLLLSTIRSWTIAVKIGRATATWDEGAETLTLACSTTGAAIKYSVDGSAPTVTYSGPISIAESTTVRWKATKASMVDSDEWQTAVLYADGAPPADFETVYFSALSAIANSPINVVFALQQKPNWYVAVGASGDGKTPATPGSATTIIGLNGTPGLAFGYRQISASKSGTADVQLATSGSESFPTGTLTKYSTNGGGSWSTYSSAFALSVPGEFWAKLVDADGDDWTQVFKYKWFLGTGTGVQIEETWDATAKTLTLAYAPAPTDPTDIGIVYSLDGSDPTIPYEGPITIAATCTPKARAVHAQRGNLDFPSQTEIKTLTAIDPEATGDFSDEHSVTFALIGTSSVAMKGIQQADCIWCSEGTYDNPSGTTTVYYRARPGVTVRGGYNEDFTERDVKGRKTIFRAVKWGSAEAESLNDYAIHTTYADGLWFESEIASSLSYPDLGYETLTHAMHGPYLNGGWFHNCHIDWTAYRGGGAGGGVGIYSQTSSLSVHPVTAEGYPYLYACSISVDAEVGKGEDGSIGDEWESSSGYEGGRSEVLISLPGPQVTAARCAFNLRAVSGGGGNGGDGGAATSPYEAASYGGNGGSTSATAVCTYQQYDCTWDMEVNSGDGGDGGAGGSASATYVARSEGGKGGTASAIGWIYADERCTIDASVISGSGGNGGAGGTTSAYDQYSIGGDGATTAATADTYASLRGTLDLVAEAGHGGNGGVGGTDTGDGADSSSRANSGSDVHCSTVDAQVIAGAGGTGTVVGESIAVLTSVLGYESAVHGSIEGETKGYWICGASPCFFESGDITISESAPYGDGNPIRVDHAADSIIGWYSGMDNGDGAPLAGYETPQGTGVALGDYWE